MLPRRRLVSVLKLCLAIALLSLILLASRLSNLGEEIHVRYPPQRLPPYICPRSNGTDSAPAEVAVQNWNATWKSDAKVLVFVETFYSKLGKQILNIIDAIKVPRKVETLSKNLPLLTTAKRGRFSIIIIENYYKYLNLPAWNRQLLDKYCRDYGVGIISFLASRSADYIRAKVKDSPLTFRQKQRAANLRFSAHSVVNFLAKPGAVLEAPQPDTDDWILFDISKGFESVISAEDVDGEERAAVVHDRGLADGVERILFGHNFTHWINKIAFVDALRHLGEGSVRIDLNRFIQIDVDDIFVGMSGSRMTRSDADALLDSQNRLRRFIANFTYCLGFSGSFFRNGDSLEVKGDERLIEIANNFVWFPHMWRHNHAHELNVTQLKAVMTLNKMFAQSWKISVDSHYAISPQHAGVYPVHEELYDSWRDIWDIRVTSTEEYPHFRPSSARRGFIYKNISVLPRQTCGLYTHTHFFHSYPDGLSNLLNNIEGGDLFFTILTNPFSIFMTHQQNYAHDRLGIFTFERVVNFIKCWTNLRLFWAKPMYMEQFLNKTSPEHTVVFEKSATYFDNPEAPRTAAALLPCRICRLQMFILVILLDPAIRAYSWYQHMRAHNDSAALSLSLIEILNVRSSDALPLRKLRQRCVSPGRYAHHLDRWLDVYPLSQIHVIDGDTLRYNPVAVLKSLTTSLHLPAFAYEEMLKFDERKRFFCVRGNKCLGASKGRKYPPMDEKLRARLNAIFREDNIALHKLLVRYDLPIPEWLRAQLSRPRPEE
ncbi:Bifunctional heparan sulfate N-deacetylase/N-sulfotransferase 1 [Toxocara canis]|uniref:[heparan sulfate]-glucosamine N-sulfotransferase n=1 Tax=Toxocara canis TaxID=6265 RepID=A0A0B2W5L1_TOXCA|nr:Bifunctional heparan sulfate N-deacetylase/N-sulfotransferase 1 [Toxocara canis]